MLWIVCNITGKPIQQNSDGVDYMDLMGKEHVVKHRFRNEGAAVSYATEQAKLKPKQQFAVMGITRIFETSDPKVIEKEINSRGEVLPKKAAPNV